MIKRVAGRKARFCNVACADGFATDRRYGAIYSSIRSDDGVYSVERWSLVNLECAYCGADVAGRVVELKPEWPSARAQVQS